MCEHPVYIKNKSKAFFPYRDKLYLSVPCGNCTSCRLEKQNGWFMRALFQFKEYPFACMYTLTYSDDNLPKFSSTLYPEHTDIPCFSHQHITGFVDNIRKYLMRHNHISNNDFKYMVACEYGTKDEGTKRPHYHLIFYFRYEVDYRYLHDLVRQFWGDKYGYIFPDITGVDKKSNFYRTHYPPRHKIVVNSANASAKYVSKYVTKDLEFFNQPKLKAFINDDLKKADPRTYEIRFNEIKRFLPKHWQSRGFGLALLQEVELRKDYYLSGGKYIDLLDYKKYRIPSYILDKLRYINCCYQRKEYNPDPRIKRIYMHLIRCYKLGLPYHPDLLKWCRNQLRRLECIRYKTNYYNNLLKSKIDENFEKTKEKIREWTRNIGSSDYLSNLINPSNRFRSSFGLLSSNDNREVDRFATFLTYFRGRQLTHWRPMEDIFDLVRAPFVFTEKINLDYKPDKEMLDFLFRREPIDNFTYCDDFQNFTFSDLEQFKPYEELSMNFFNFFSRKSADLAKKCLDLQKFYKELKNKRRNYNNFIHYDCKTKKMLPCSVQPSLF